MIDRADLKDATGIDKNHDKNRWNYDKIIKKSKTTLERTCQKP